MLLSFCNKLYPEMGEYKMLKDMFPEQNEFYSYYYDGDYYNRAYVTYYDKDGNEIHRKTYDYYG